MSGNDPSCNHLLQDSVAIDTLLSYGVFLNFVERSIGNEKRKVLRVESTFFRMISG